MSQPVPLADATAVSFTGPLFVAALAVRSGDTEGVRIVVANRTRRDPAEVGRILEGARSLLVAASAIPIA